MRTVAVTHPKTGASVGSYTVNFLKMQLNENTFKENFVGNGGSAVYIKNFRKVEMKKNIFSYNGPSISSTEEVFSEYYKKSNGLSTLRSEDSSFPNEIQGIDSEVQFPG